MTDQCQYLVISADGDPVVMEAHPYPGMVSDDLGGAIPVPIVINHGRTCLWVRETAATEGYHRNLTASVIATLMNDDRRPILVVGPAVITQLQPVGVSAAGGVLVSAEGFNEVTAAALAEVTADVQAAITGSDGPFVTDDLSPGWAAKVRGFASRIGAMKVPDTWPDSENRVPATDPVCRVLEQLMPDRQFVPMVTGPAH